MKTTQPTKHRLLNVALLCATAVASSAFAQDTAVPAKVALCSSCHGENGAKPIAPSYPKINGQNKEYLVSALKAYKAGERKNAMAAVMTAQSAALSDAEIEALAAYYSALP